MHVVEGVSVEYRLSTSTTEPREGMGVVLNTQDSGICISITHTHTRRHAHTHTYTHTHTHVCKHVHTQ